MSDAINIPPEDWSRLAERAQKLAQENFTLQLVSRLMKRLSEVPGIENTVETILGLVHESLGGTDIALYYPAGSRVHYAGVHGERKIVEILDEPLVRQAFERGECVEEVRETAGSKAATREPAKAADWAVPLKAARQVIGVLKMEAMLPERAEMRRQLEPFFDYASLLLQHELTLTEHQQAEQKAAMLAAIVQSSDDAIIGKTLDGTITSWNKGAQGLYGYTEQEMLGRPISLLAAPGLEEEIPRLLTKLRGGEHIEHYETRRRRKDGQLIQVSLAISPIRNAQGQLVAASSIERNISERKRAEAALWASSQMLRLVLDNMPAFVFWKDRHSVYLGCNRLFAANAGLGSPEEIVGLTDLDLPWKDTEAQSYRADDRRVMESGVPKLNYEETQLTADGRLAGVRTSKVPLRSPEGDVIGVLGTFEDITERKQAEQRLAEAEAKYRCLVEESLVGVYLIQQGRFVYVNACMARVFGYRREELVDRPVEELVVPEDRGVVTGNIQKREVGQVRSMNYSFRGLRKDGRVIDVEVLGTSTVYHGRPAVIGSLLDITERKRAEQNIALLSFALNNVREAAFLIDEQARFHYVNEEACRLLGYTRAELLGLSVPAVDPGFPAERWPAHWANLKAQRSLGFEGSHRTKDGRVFPVEVSANYFEYGGKAYNLALVRDITERKRMEQALAAREREFRSLAENSPELIARYDRGCRQLYLSPAVGRLTSKPVESQLGLTPADAQTFPAESAAKLMTGIRQAFQSGELGHVDLDFALPDGRRTDYQMLLVPECAPDGEVATVLGLARDLTAIRNIERRMTRFLANVPGFVYSFRLSPEGRFSFPFVSPGILTLYGLKPEEVREDVAPLFALIHQDDRPRVQEAIAESAQTMELFRAEFRVCRPGQPERWVESRSTPERDVDGGTLWHGMILDITERKRAEQEIKQLNESLEKRVAERTADLQKTSAELRQSQNTLLKLVEDLNKKTAALEVANKELEAFSYSVSHDLRTPLRGIDGFSQLLLRRHAGKLDEEGKSYVQLVRSNTQRMSQLIDDLLNLSRVSRGELRIQKVSLSRLAQNIGDELARREPERQVALVIAPNVAVTGDAGFLRIVLENLLGNAWKFTSRRPEARIEFGVTQQEGRPVYFVRDDGAGFDMKDANRLFGAFQRLHSGAEFPGTGIGLATVERIIRRHGGRVWAEGRVGKGATFYFTLS